MNKDEYRAEVLKELREIRLNTEITSAFCIIATALLFFVTIILLFK
ncbi:hypothetical protein [Butyrivibrio sp.]|nr:hypothetical protein [Butyrivibrio sp.]MBQ7428356.1 hypothetical protein [Butyrivibrio sp.]MBQ9303660.1 hypothetical protein [Butyrivibrio sp.]